MERKKMDHYLTLRLTREEMYALWNKAEKAGVLPTRYIKSLVLSDVGVEPGDGELSPERGSEFEFIERLIEMIDGMMPGEGEHVKLTADSEDFNPLQCWNCYREGALEEVKRSLGYVARDKGWA